MTRDPIPAARAQSPIETTEVAKLAADTDHWPKSKRPASGDSFKCLAWILG